MMKKVLESKLIQENNSAALQNTATDVSCLGDDRSAAADQNALSRAVQKETASSRSSEGEIPEGIDAKSNKAMAGRFATIFSLVLLCLCFVFCFFPFN